MMMRWIRFFVAWHSTLWLETATITPRTSDSYFGKDNRGILSPAYDVTHAYNPQGEWTYQHLMSVNQKFTDISKEDLLAVADRFGIRKPENVLSAVRAAIDNWSEFAQQANLSSALQIHVAKDLLLL
jgi:hypothetical protein